MAFKTTLKRFIADERGATAVEYGLITALDPPPHEERR